MEERRKKTIRTKILVIPLVCVAAGILIIGVLSSYLTRRSMLDEMEQNGYASAQQLVNQVEANSAGRPSC
ncbi:hypothetical protein Q5O24_13590 [Eubacteriaceae bacterium ES3]|nr:hypothetical protein Q5O24_13590 [Eubacteriaceae bacterium ES3]